MVRKNTTKRSSCSGWTARGERAGLDRQPRITTNSGLLTPSESARHSSDEKCVHSALSRVLGVDELAAFFNCSKAKVKRRARSGELPAFKFGKSWFVREHDLELYIQRKVESNLPRRRMQ